MRRRSLMKAAAVPTLAMLAVAQRTMVLKSVPQADLAILAPVYATASVTRHQAFLVFHDGLPVLAADAVDIPRGAFSLFWGSI